MTFLFKAKVKHNGNHLFSGDWVQGSLIKKTKGYFIYVIEEDDLGNVVREFEVEVIPETVCQFTGEFDKDGNNIFNGDICESSYYNTPLAYSKEKPSYTYLNQVVEFSVGCFILRNMEEHDDWKKSIRNKTELYYIKYTLTIKVIGNIHD